MLIDREALSKWCHETMSAQTTVAGMAYIREFWNKVLDAPVVDAVEVVRCKDCVFYQPDDLCCPCSANDDGEAMGLERPHDEGYCSYGRRESEGT